VVIVEAVVVCSLVASWASLAAMFTKTTIPLFPTWYVSLHRLCMGYRLFTCELNCLMCMKVMWVLLGSLDDLEVIDVKLLTPVCPQLTVQL
jgi:hypothetical protein